MRLDSGPILVEWLGLNRDQAFFGGRKEQRWASRVLDTGAGSHPGSSVGHQLAVGEGAPPGIEIS